LSKNKVDFLEGPLFPANQRSLKAFNIALIGWMKAGPPKKSLLLWTCNASFVA